MYTLVRMLIIVFVMIAYVSGVTAQSSWKIFAELKSGRHHHTAKYLNGDKVLVIGGYVNSYDQLTGLITNTTELVDLVTGKVTAGPSMQYPRALFATLTMPDGDLIVFGGWSRNGPLTSIERLDVQTLTWSNVGNMNEARSQHCADFIDQDQIMIFGDFDSNTAEIFTLSTGISRYIASINSNANSAVSINPLGRGPSFWGFREGGPSSARPTISIRYEPDSNRWVNDLDFNDDPVAPQLVTLRDGSIFVASGAVSELTFKTSPKTWIVSPDGIVTRGADLLEGRQWHTVGSWNDNRILVTSGYVDGASFSSSCEWVNISSSSSEPAPSLNIPRSYAKMVVVKMKDGITRAFVFSGLTSFGNTPTIEVLEDSCDLSGQQVDLSTMKLVGSAALNADRIQLTSTKRYEAGSAWLKNRLPIVAGFDVSFSFRLIDGNDGAQLDGGPQGADGIVMVLQNETPSIVGKPGDGIGYDGVPHGLAIEFDSYLNAAFSDPAGSHIAVQVGDNMILRPIHAPPYLKGITTTGFPPFVADGSTYYARVRLNGTTLEVFCDKTPTLETPALVVNNIDISKILNLNEDGVAFLGFTSSTGFSTEIHELLSVEIKGCQGLVSDVNEKIYNSVAPATIIPTPSFESAILRIPSLFETDLHCMLVDMNGTTVASLILESGHTEVSIPTVSLASGIYRVVVLYPQGAYSIPLIIVR